MKIPALQCSRVPSLLSVAHGRIRQRQSHVVRELGTNKRGRSNVSDAKKSPGSIPAGSIADAGHDRIQGTEGRFRADRGREGRGSVGRFRKEKKGAGEGFGKEMGQPTRKTIT
jgi:hypothetical protein